jgi:hypothetical protein
LAKGPVLNWPSFLGGVINLFDLEPFQAAIILTVHFAIGYGFYLLAQGARNRIKGTWGRVLSWPCYGVAIIFISSAIFGLLITMFGLF